MALWLYLCNWKLSECGFEPWLMRNKFIFTKIIFGMDEKGQKP